MVKLMETYYGRKLYIQHVALHGLWPVARITQWRRIWEYASVMKVMYGMYVDYKADLEVQFQADLNVKEELVSSERARRELNRILG